MSDGSMLESGEWRVEAIQGATWPALSRLADTFRLGGTVSYKVAFSFRHCLGYMIKGSGI